jgi:hypothetical protein
MHFIHTIVLLFYFIMVLEEINSASRIKDITSVIKKIKRRFKLIILFTLIIAFLIEAIRRYIL